MQKTRTRFWHVFSQDIVGNRGRYLDPLAGATTVFDEEPLSRTRFLQWAIQSLAIYELSVLEAIGVFEDFQATTFPDEHPNCSFAGAEKVMRQAMSKTAKFEELSTKMHHLINRATIERDGLGAFRMERFGFQAICHHSCWTRVPLWRVETRQNVQLLTYINIVFLTLSFGTVCNLQIQFCMSYRTWYSHSPLWISNILNICCKRALYSGCRISQRLSVSA
jgi:hypothetical protein